MPKGSNCALVHEYKVEFTSGVYLKQNYCYSCANNIHYIGDIREWQ